MPGNIYYETRVPEIYGSTISLCALATFLTVLRVVARGIAGTKLWWDDWMIFMAVICNWGLNICFWLEINTGLGRHMVTYGGPVPLENLVPYFKLALAIQLLYFTCAAAIKTSLILLYYRLFGIVRQYTYVLLGAWIIVMLYWFIDIFVATFECHPVAFYWDHSIKGGKCINQKSYYRWNGVANLLIDFLILSLPLPMVWQLRLATRQKVSLSAVFLVGILACTASIIRVTSFSEVILEDTPYTIAHPTIWTSVEQSLGIICACLSTLRPLFNRILPALNSGFRSTNASSAKGKHDSKSESNRNPISLSALHLKTTDLTKKTRGQQLSRPGREASDGMAGGFQRLSDEEHMPFPLYESYISTDAERNSDPDLEGLSADSRPVIMKKQSIEQYSSGAGSVAAGHNIAAT